jgi:hypothetical protein
MYHVQAYERTTAMSGGYDLTVARTDWADRVAIGTSIACLLHCVGLPLIVAALPALSVVVPESFHLWVLAVAIPLALVALWQGRARHRRRWPLIVGVAGLTLLAAGALAFDHDSEVPATVAGSLVLALAHISNWRLRQGQPV